MFQCNWVAIKGTHIFIKRTQTFIKCTHLLYKRNQTSGKHT